MSGGLVSRRTWISRGQHSTWALRRARVMRQCSRLRDNMHSSLPKSRLGEIESGSVKKIRSRSRRLRVVRVRIGSPTRGRLLLRLGSDVSIVLFSSACDVCVRGS